MCKWPYLSPWLGANFSTPGMASYTIYFTPSNMRQKETTVHKAPLKNFFLKKETLAKTPGGYPWLLLTVFQSLGSGWNNGAKLQNNVHGLQAGK